MSTEKRQKIVFTTKEGKKIELFKTKLIIDNTPIAFNKALELYNKEINRQYLSNTISNFVNSPELWEYFKKTVENLIRTR